MIFSRGWGDTGGQGGAGQVAGPGGDRGVDQDVPAGAGGRRRGSGAGSGAAETVAAGPVDGVLHARDVAVARAWLRGSAAAVDRRAGLGWSSPGRDGCGLVRVDSEGSCPVG